MLLSASTLIYRKVGKKCFRMLNVRYMCIGNRGHLQQTGNISHVMKNVIYRHLKTSTYILDKSGSVNVKNKDPETEDKLSKGVREIVVKTETDENKVVTKVTIEKPQKAASTTKEEIAPQVKKRLLIDFSASYTERNFITPMRAMTEYLLKQSDLESLPKVLRRSPYESEPPITVHYRKDVEAKAIEVWGSREVLEKELLRRELDRRRYEQDVFTVKRRLRNYRREMSDKRLKQAEELGLKTRSGRVVLTAIGINGCNFLFKLCAWFYTGSHSLFSECIHSLADTVNQLILAYGIHKSVQIADPDHPYGYTNMRYVSSLISGVGIFCVGSGLSFYHGVVGILDPQPLHDFFWAYFVLGGAVVSEGATLMVALSAIRKGAKEANMSLREYVLRSSDPSVNVVLLEDTAAVAGVVVAASCMAVSQYTGNPLFDAVGSILVGTILGGVASFIILSNVGALVGRSIPQEQLDEINSVLERDFMIRAIHDVKGIDIGSNLIRYKAEVDFDGRALTRSYLEKHDLNALLEDIRKIETIDNVEAFLLKHGENIVDMLGGEIDRIELKLRKKFPQIRHCDLEIL
ncbi:PREDICTED: zinc transporter 9 [Papilio xuthus]|uniref:Proton-coupled zinc antiporter SLC30A9, mitochondrial n=1 Tax=Papilio xuthus TaxID=66420 RepID=A0AAJ6ZM83_PAPXU|nr:PREDICTED: zinc transporter 9 [Papilio xuthus]